MTDELKRWSDDAPESYRTAKSAYAELGPRAEQLECMLERVEQVVHAPGTSGLGSRPDPRASTGSWLGVKPWVWLVPAIGALGTVLFLVVVRPSGDSPVPRTSVLGPRARGHASAALEAGPLGPAAVSAPGVPKDVAPATSSIRAASQAKPSREKPAAAPDPLSELALLDRARRVMKADPARALKITEEHRQRYRAGQFAEERELLAIQALIGAGQRPAAERRARSFARAHPNSVHSHRLGVILQREAP